jgi:hypothetical protein
MAALIAMPAVAFALLMAIIYEDRLLPQGDALQPSSTGDRAESPADALATLGLPQERGTPALALGAAEPPAGDAGAAGSPADDTTVPRRAGTEDSHGSARRHGIRGGGTPLGRSRAHRLALGAAAEGRAVTSPHPAGRPELRLRGTVSVPRR